MSEPRTYRLTGARYRALCVADWPPEAARQWVDDPGASFASGYPDPSSSGVRLEDSTGRRLFVKRHRRARSHAWLDRLAGRPTRALRAFRIGGRLAACGVSAARPLAAIESRWPGESYTLLEVVEGSTLREHLLGRPFEPADSLESQGRRGELWSAIGGLVARLHAAGIRQRDLKSLNLMVSQPEEGRPPVVTLVDLEGMSAVRGGLPSARARLRDLSRLAASLRTPELRDAGIAPADWERLLREYLEASRACFPGGPPIDWWLERSIDWAERKATRNARRGRPLR